MANQFWTAFSYGYRDAGNFKATGEIWLRGSVSQSDRSAVEASLEAGQFFVAEQLCIPTLYADLYKWSDGHRISDDHCWHEFLEFTEVPNLPKDVVVWGDTKELVQKFKRVAEWDGSLSVHFA